MSVTQSASGFDRLLSGFSPPDLDDYPDPVFGMWSDLRLAYLNTAWFRFAAENDGEPAISRHWGLGASVMAAVPDVLKPFYHRLYSHCLQLSGGPAPRHLSYEYDCSSPEHYRRYAMTVYPLGRSAGLLVINARRIERPQDQAAVRDPRDADYIDGNGFFAQCAHCRKFRNFTEAGRWDWIPQWVRRNPEPTSHGLCGVCFEYYYRRAGGQAPG